MKYWVLTLALTLAACGSSDEDNKGSTSSGGNAGSSGSGASGGSGNSGGSSGSGGSAGSSGSGGTQGQEQLAAGTTPICGMECDDPNGCYPCAEGSESVIQAMTYTCYNGCWTKDTIPAQSCELFGRSYPPGNPVPDVYGCNECECAIQGAGGEAEIGCSTQACSCEGLSGVDLVSDDPSKCAALTFSCPPNTEPITGDCGCGCRQNPNCASAYDCRQGCDRDVIQDYCPFSTIVD